MEGGTASLTTLQSYKNIAKDPEKRKILFKDQAALQFFVYCLMDADPKVVHEALQILLFLCDNKEHCTQVASVYGIIPTLNLISGSYKEYSPQISKLKSLLADTIKPDIARNATPNQDGHRKSFFVGAVNSKAKTVVLHVDGLISQDHRHICEEQLLKIKGVISITFNLAKSRCILRAKTEVNPEALVKALSTSSGLKASQVVKGENGEEKFLSFVEPSPITKENIVLPDYLPEEESPVRDKSVAKMDSNNPNKSGWLNSAANFLARSFYW